MSCRIKDVKFLIGLIVLTIAALTLPARISYAQRHASPNYYLENAGIAASSGRAASAGYSLIDAVVGNITGGSASSPGYILRIYSVRGGETSIYLCPLDWVVDGIKPGDSMITGPDKKIAIENDSSAAIKLSLRVVDPANTWIPSLTPGSKEPNHYELSAILMDMSLVDVTQADFNESGAEDMVSADFTPATEARFAASKSNANGARIRPKEKRALWFKFTAPSIDTTQETKHNLWLIIEAKGGE